MKFASGWWSVELPSGWHGHEEATCASISRDLRSGVLQISAARKPQESVNDDDLRDFAKEHIASDKSLVPVTYELFRGFFTSYTKDGLSWKEWWLRSGNIVVYATYNVRKGQEEIETNDLNDILASLKPLRAIAKRGALISTGN